MTSISVVLTADQQKFVDRAIRSGSFLTQGEVVATAIEVLKNQELMRQLQQDELRREIQVGIDQFDSGRTSEFSFDEIKEEGRRLLALER